MEREESTSRETRGEAPPGRKTAERDRLRPVDMERHTDRVLIAWADGHRSLHPYADLRRACPCATCRSQREAAAASRGLRVLSPRASTRAELADVQWVGRYAFRFAWRDGHDTGIYSFELLRELCACPVCRPPSAG